MKPLRWPLPRVAAGLLLAACAPVARAQDPAVVTIRLIVVELKDPG